MDDILLLADSEEEMLQLLHRLFTRFREYNGEYVEYVGHLIDSEGMHFTRTKLDSIAMFKKPNNVQSEAFAGTRELLSRLCTQRFGASDSIAEARGRLHEKHA
jgi:hypothetical protein